MNVISTCPKGHRYHIADNECPHCTPYEVQHLAAAYAALRRAQAQVTEWTKAAQAAGIDLEQYKERLQP